MKMSSDKRIWYIKRLRAQYQEEKRIADEARREAETAAKMRRRR